MRLMLRKLDAWLSRKYGIFEFTQEEECLFRLQVGKAPHRLQFSDCAVEKGETVLILHLWNEHLARFSLEQPELAWGKKMHRALIRSLVGIARQMEMDPKLREVKAVGGVTILLYSGARSSSARLMPKLGFTVMPYSGRLGRFGEFWENIYSWLLIWVYNPHSLGSRPLTNLRRAEFWAPAGDFRRRYSVEPSIEKSGS